MEIISPKMDFAFRELMEDDEVRRYFICDALNMSVEQVKETRLGNSFFFKETASEDEAGDSRCESVAARRYEDQPGDAVEAAKVLGETFPVLSCENVRGYSVYGGAF